MENNLVYNKSAIVEVTKEFTFDSCHFLKEYKGKCSRLHGHTYRLQVTLIGYVNEIGMVIDFNTLKDIVTKEVIDRVDHFNLNEKFKFNTTAENMVVYFFEVIESALMKEGYKNIAVDTVTLWETPTSHATYRGKVMSIRTK